MSVVLSHPTGNANVRAALDGLHNANILSGFYTGIASFEGNWVDKLGAVKSLSEIRRRRFQTYLQPFTHTVPWLEAGRLLALRTGATQLTKHEKGTLSVDAVYRYHDRYVAKKLNALVSKKITGVYCYEDGAASTFKEAKRLGLKTFYDLPIGYWRAARRLLINEMERWPEWAETLHGFKDSDTKLERKEEEISLSDVIFVASSFTAKTLADFPGTLPPVKVIPYGFPAVGENRKYDGLTNKKKIKVLFVGGLSERKGIADLFAVANSLRDYIELTIVGRKASATCVALETSLAKHKWIPGLPHHDVLQLMRQQDLLVFPSLFEGFGLVISEAMSQGMPVITTERTAGPDLIQHAHNGWLVEAGSTMALQEAVEHFVRNPHLLFEFGKAARETASLRPWSVYGNELANAIANIINQ